MKSRRLKRNDVADSLIDDSSREVAVLLRIIVAVRAELDASVVPFTPRRLGKGDRALTPSEQIQTVITTFW